jgi:hypothetical protein
MHKPSSRSAMELWLCLAGPIVVAAAGVLTALILNGLLQSQFPIIVRLLSAASWLLLAAMAVAFRRRSSWTRPLAAFLGLAIFTRSWWRYIGGDIELWYAGIGTAVGLFALGVVLFLAPPLRRPCQG